MKASPLKREGQRLDAHTSPPQGVASEDGIDISLLEESLTKTVCERMLANDDALRLADLLQTAMLKSRAKP
jgi:hypothetical protein